MLRENSGAGFHAADALTAVIQAATAHGALVITEPKDEVSSPSPSKTRKNSRTGVTSRNCSRPWIQVGSCGILFRRVLFRFLRCWRRNHGQVVGGSSTARVSNVRAAGDNVNLYRGMHVMSSGAAGTAGQIRVATAVDARQTGDGKSMAQDRVATWVFVKGNSRTFNAVL